MVEFFFMNIYISQTTSLEIYDSFIYLLFQIDLSKKLWVKKCPDYNKNEMELKPGHYHKFKHLFIMDAA